MKNAIKKIMAFVLVIAMVAGVLPSVFAASEYVEPFKDVKTTDWFAPYVTYVYEHDPQLMNGVTKDTFAPNGTCTRAMAAVVLYRLADPVIPSVKPSTFTDLKQDWYKNGIAWAQQNGVVNGVTETTFVPDGLVLREQLVTMLWRYAGEPKVAEDYLKSFPDREKVSYYAREAFNWAISLEIIGGANGMLNPQGNATRAEFAKILSVFAQKTAPCQHKWDEGKVTKEATCTATGVMTYTCTLCGETKTETIPMIAHNYVDGVCSVCGAQEPDPGPGPGPGPEPTPGNEYVLASEIKDGDEVIIYNPGHGKAIKNENDNNWYLIAQEITPADSKITTDDTTIVWTANKNDDGTFTFTNGENAITAWLSENDKGTFVELTNDANYTGGDTKWNVTTCNAATNTFFISSSSIATSYGPGHIECYAKSGVDKIAGFGKANPTETDFGFQFYVKGGTAPDPGPGPEPTPGNEYVLTSELKEGDEVVIVCAAKNVALGNTYSGYYNNAIAVTPENGKIVDPSADVVWTVGKEGEFYTFSFNGQKIAMGTGFTSMPLGEVNYKWQLQNAATEGAFYLANLDREAGKEYRMQYQEDRGTWSAYHTIAEGAEGAFALNFYVKGGTAPDPGPGPEPTPGNEYVLTSELKEGDEVVIVCAAKNVALGNTYSGYYNNAIAVTPENGKIVDPSADVVWTVGKEGEFYTFTFNGQKIAMGTGFTSMPLGEVNYKWQLQNAATEGAFYLANLDREAGKEYRMQYQEDRGTWSAYHTIAEGAEGAFALNFYVKGAEAPDTPVDPPVDPPTPGNEYVLTSELKEGDEVVIVCAAKNVALGNTYSGYYNNAIAVTPENGKIVDPSADVIWTVGKEGEFYTFTFNGQKIAMGTGFTSMPLGEVNYKWQLQNAATEGEFYLANLDREAGKEYRMQYQEDKGTWSAYHTIAEGAEGAFALNFYVKGGEAACVHEWDAGEVTKEATCTDAGVKTFTCTKCQATKTESIGALGHIDENNDDKCDRCGADLSTPDAADYVLASELKDGDEVIIVNVDFSKAMSEDAVATKYRAGVDVTPENDTITTNDSKIVWDVVAVDGGFQFRNDNGETLSATSGLSFASTDNVWALTAGTAENTFIISSTTATGSSGDPKSIEWFATYNEFSTYYKNNDNENLFAVKLYVKGGEPACKHVWDNGEVTTEPWCTVAGEKTFTCELCGDTRTEVILALGHIDENNDDMCDRCRANLAAGAYSVADTLAVGDKIILVIEYDGKFYAAANDNKTVNNALNAIEVDVNDKGLILPDGADVVWEVCKGSAEGTFTLKSSDGKYIYNPEKKTNVSLADEGSDLTITCGDGTSKILLTSTASATTVRNLFLRMNNGVPQFRFYSTANTTTSGYSSVLTIWKAD